MGEISKCLVFYPITFLTTNGNCGKFTSDRLKLIFSLIGSEVMNYEFE